jgi:murein L,D-transpeptidase YcbB/YkuD
MMRYARTLFVAALLQTALAFGQAQPMDAVSEAIREHVDRLRYAEVRDVHGAHVILRDAVAHLYEERQFRSSWSDPIRLNQLVVALADLESDGLDPRDYHLDALTAIRDELRGAKTLSAAEQGDLDLIATDALALALYHLYAGKVDPIKISAQWNFDMRPLRNEDALRVLLEVLDSGRIREVLAAARPQHVWYELGRERLRQYRRIADEGGWPSITPGPTLKPGVTDERVGVLRRRLRITGDLPVPGSAESSTPTPTSASAPTAGSTDGSIAGGSATNAESIDPANVYDAAVEAGVRHFQQRHALGTDGAVGPATLAALNVPVATRIDQLRLNLERGRWVLHEIKGEFVLVDVAGFYVSYFRDDKPIWTSRVVVGRPYRETPIFKSEITYVVFNPTWTVPPGILAKDKLPAIRRDPGYLKRNNIRVIDSHGREVAASAVDWQRYSAGNLPYQLRQDPGPDNALGLVKIMFPNPYLVYLHDSPAKALYERDERAFSSGCIRVQKPFELTELVLNDPERWNQTTMQAAIKTGETQTVNLRKPLPVLILYWTAQPTADGQIIFRNDVYGRDPPLLRALDSAFKVPPPLTDAAATAP